MCICLILKGKQVYEYKWNHVVFCRIFNAWVLIKIMTFYSKEIAISADKLPEICIIKKYKKK